MQLPQALSTSGVPEALEVFQPHWEESAQSLGGQTPWFLTDEEVRAARPYGGFSEDVEPALIREARRIAADPALRLLAWHCHRLLYEHPEYDRSRDWPPALGGLFYLLVGLSMVRQVRKVHAEMGVDDAVTRATCSQLSCFSLNYARANGGELGVLVTQLFWTRLYPAGKLFRVGRMEYMIHPFQAGVQVYRDARSGRVVALAPDGARYTEEGFGAFADESAWVASSTTSPDAVEGYPISPAGMALHRLVRLPLDRWARVLGPGDVTLDMHIPAGGAMTPEASGASMRDAVAFFHRHFPQIMPRAIACQSWTFNPQLESVKLSSDNLVRLQRELYLFPVDPAGGGGLWFIFMTADVDPRTAPRDTSLRRGVADFLATGERWRSGAMFFLPEDLAAYGTQVYRSNWPPKDLPWL